MNTIAKLTDTVAVGTGATTLIDVLANVNRLIKQVTFFNSSATVTIKVTVYDIPTGQTADDTNTVAELSIQPRKTWICYELAGKTVPADHKLQAKGDTAGVYADIDGLKIT